MNRDIVRLAERKQSRGGRLKDNSCVYVYKRDGERTNNLTLRGGARGGRSQEGSFDSYPSLKGAA